MEQEPLSEETLKELLDADAVRKEHQGETTALQEWAVDNLEEAKEAIEYCLKHAEKDSTRLSAARLILQESKGTKEQEDHIQRLIDSLTSE
jgi:hypothetical protein